MSIVRCDRIETTQESWFFRCGDCKECEKKEEYLFTFGLEDEAWSYWTVWLEEKAQEEGLVIQKGKNGPKYSYIITGPNAGKGSCTKQKIFELLIQLRSELIRAGVRRQADDQIKDTYFGLGFLPKRKSGNVLWEDAGLTAIFAEVEKQYLKQLGLEPLAVPEVNTTEGLPLGDFAFNERGEQPEVEVAREPEGEIRVYVYSENYQGDETKEVLKKRWESEDKQRYLACLRTDGKTELLYYEQERSSVYGLAKKQGNEDYSEAETFAKEALKYCTEWVLGQLQRPVEELTDKDNRQKIRDALALMNWFVKITK